MQKHNKYCSYCFALYAKSACEVSHSPRHGCLDAGEDVFAFANASKEGARARKRTSESSEKSLLGHRCLIWGPPMVTSKRCKTTSQLTLSNIASTSPSLATSRGRLP